jgi:nucleoside 2-deoxyribosyltransferase
MPHKRRRVYCAGPLFNDKEREEMKELADAFEAEGFDTFLPQRDGIEFSVCIEMLTERGFSPDDASQMLSKAIFALDAFQVVSQCDAIVVNLNGRVPDEGAVSEAAMAWCYGKHMVGYKSDARSLLSGQDNPLVSGLFDFALCTNMIDAVASLKESVEERPTPEEQVKHQHKQLDSYLELGERIWQATLSENRLERIATVLAAASEPHRSNRTRSSQLA